MSKAGKEVIAGAEQALTYIKGDKTKGCAHKLRDSGMNVEASTEISDINFV